MEVSLFQATDIPSNKKKAKTPPYTCPRCGFFSIYKNNIRAHFRRQQVCAGLIDNRIELTPELKNLVLINHVYKPPEHVFNTFNMVYIQNLNICQV